MEESILKTIKKILGIDPSYQAFDVDILTHINSAIGTLVQLGIGPVDGFVVEDDSATWEDLLGPDPKKFNGAKTYVGLKVRLWFDPPVSGFAITAMEKQILEQEWRLEVERTPDVPEDDLVVDGGTP